MKARRMKLTACLLAGAILFSTGAAPAMAGGAKDAADLPMAGFSLALADVDLEEEDRLSQDIKQEAEEAAREQEAVEQALAEFYARTGVVQTDDYVNVRSGATEDSEIVGRMENHAVAQVEGEENGWYRITSGSISGYIRGDFLTVGDRELIDSVKLRMAEVQADTLRVRAEASTEAEIRTLAADGSQLQVLDESIPGWVKVSTAEGEGYVSADYVSVADTFLYAKEPEQVSGGSAVAEYGLQFVGNPYVWGGTSLTNGADCSGFVMSVYAHFGVSLPHSSAAQRGVGREVSYSEAQPGDIICYSGHVAIYIGGGQIVHAANERSGIKVSSATYNNILTVRRIFN